jgi:photosynthetic reaction center cytochrome c subunit
MRAMKRAILLSTAAVFAFSLALAGQQPPPGGQQPPAGQPPQGAPPQGGRQGGPPGPPPKNLQVLPKDLTRQQVVQIMRGFTRGLGVRCPYCHVGEEGADLSTFDFASDEKANKKTARLMIQMSEEANTKLANVGDKPAGERRVTCYTCHRGQEKPLTAPPQQGG